MIHVCKAANGLREIGIKKGDRVTIYLTMIPELSLRDVSLCKNWCNSFHNIWWFFSRLNSW